MVVMKDDESKSFPFHFLDVPPGAMERTENGYYNKRHLIVSSELINKLKSNGITSENIGIIAPYRNHANQIHRQTRNTNADTVHRYQGRECDVIIYDTVTDSITRFNDDPRLINVAVSRAKERLYLVGSEEMLRRQDSNLASLLNYIRYYDPEGTHIVHTHYHSIFDILHTQGLSQEEWQAMRIGHESPAETLFRHILERQLEVGEYRGWTFTQEYYLIDLVHSSTAASLFTADEWQFMLHGSRLDFLLFDSIQHLPILAIEVDGQQHTDPLQTQRDLLKNTILQKLSVPLLRFSTNNEKGQEEHILSQKLKSIYTSRNA